MRLGRCVLKNYGSYKSLDFNYANLGLALLSGATKSGKSTILDAAGWILFGKTSKELNADDVKSWFGEEETSGNIRVDLPNRCLFVTRIRGKRPAQNDLYFYVERDAQHGAAEPTRGKDVNDTQRLINEELGVGPDLYFAASYLHQFSGDRFFTADAKDRRKSMEKIADMSLAINLGQRASDLRKEAKRDLDTKIQSKSRLEGKAETLRSSLSSLLLSQERWEFKQKLEVDNLEAKATAYEQEKEDRVYALVDQLEALEQQIKPEEEYTKRGDSLRSQLKLIEPLEKELRDLNSELATAAAELKSAEKAHDKYAELNETCPTCLGPSDNPNRAAYLEEIEAVMQSLISSKAKLRTDVERLTDAIASKPKLQDALQKLAIEQMENRRRKEKFDTVRAQAIALRREVNPYLDQVKQALTAVNPYLTDLDATTAKIGDAEWELKVETCLVAGLEHKISSLTWLYDKSYELRGLFLARSVAQINTTTNRILERYFDATLRVDFALADSDKLEVTITNEGYEAKYAQLSGGERCMLKLAFSMGYMKAAENTAGTKFQTLMLDEAMNGLDASLKVKAFGLLQELESEYSTLLLIDHAEEFKQLFSNKFLVTKDGAYSSVTADSI